MAGVGPLKAEPPPQEALAIVMKKLLADTQQARLAAMESCVDAKSVSAVTGQMKERLIRNLEMAVRLLDSVYKLGLATLNNQITCIQTATELTTSTVVAPESLVVEVDPLPGPGEDFSSSQLEDQLRQSGRDAEPWLKIELEDSQDSYDGIVDKLANAETKNEEKKVRSRKRSKKVKKEEEGLPPPPKKGSRTEHMCDQCGKAEVNAARLEAHRLMVHEGQGAKCTHGKCNYQAASRAQLLKHEKRVHKLLYCDQCPWSGTNYANFMYHKRAKHQVVRFKCKDCAYETAYDYYLKIHAESVHQGVRYPCEVCGHMCSSKQALKRHRETIHEGLKHTCNICGYEVGSLSALCVHKTKHEGKVYTCETCGKSFDRRDTLKSHEKSVHSGIRYQCDQCDFSATKNCNLNRHKKSKHSSSGGKMEITNIMLVSR